MKYAWLCLLWGCTRTPCGMQAPDGLQVELSAMEHFIVQRFSLLPGWSVPTVCRALDGWTVKQIPPADTQDCRGGWFEKHTCVIGYTRIHTKEIAIVLPGLPMDTVAHEIVHVVDYATRGFPGHCDWNTRGVALALKDLAGKEDPSAGSGCPDSKADF